MVMEGNFALKSAGKFNFYMLKMQKVPIVGLGTPPSHTLPPLGRFAPSYFVILIFYSQSWQVWVYDQQPYSMSHYQGNIKGFLMCHQGIMNHSGSRRSATTSRGVFEAYSSQKLQFATVRLSMWNGAPNNAKAKGHPPSRACELHAWTESMGDKSLLSDWRACQRSLPIMKIHIIIFNFYIGNC